MTEPIKRIVVPVDGSEHAVRAARIASEMAKRLGVPLTLFHVFPLESYEIIGLSRLSKDEIDRMASSSAERITDGIRKELGDALPEDMNVKSVMGDPAEEILRIADDDMSTLLIMGRRGLSRIETLILGSVSDKVLRHTHSPVLVLSA